MKFSIIEQEIIFLKASVESIDSIVNHQIFELSEGDTGSQAIFKTSIHQRYFNIILVDFLSKSAEEVTGEKISCLDALVKICESRSFNKRGSIRSLSRAVKTLKKWLEDEIKVKAWFPSISLSVKLTVQRQEFIKICGDISKHNFSRLHVRARELKNIFRRSREEVSVEQALLLLVEFYEKFHDDVFSYHGSLLIEKLNDIRWGIHQYLQPETERAIGKAHPSQPRYSIAFPNDIKSEFVKHCYSALMFAASRTPNVKTFKTVEILTRRY